MEKIGFVFSLFHLRVLGIYEDGSTVNIACSEGLVMFYCMVEGISWGDRASWRQLSFTPNISP